MKLTKSLWCVPPGEIYPRELAAGDECPAEFEEAAREQGCLDAPAPKAAKAKPVPRGGASSSGSKPR